jgi:hypothetical protein
MLADLCVNLARVLTHYQRLRVREDSGALHRAQSVSRPGSLRSPASAPPKTLHKPDPRHNDELPRNTFIGRHIRTPCALDESRGQLSRRRYCWTPTCITDFNKEVRLWPAKGKKTKLQQDFHGQKSPIRYNHGGGGLHRDSVDL